MMIDLKSFLDAPVRWLETEGPETDVVLSSRIRFSRNIVDEPFPHRLPESSRRRVLEKILSAFTSIAPLNDFKSIELIDLSSLERRVLAERLVISGRMASQPVGSGALVSKDQSTMLRINDNDHLRIQCFESGMALTKAWKRANRIDDLLSEKLSFAYDDEWGYTTSSLLETGTGLTVSCWIHVPALSLGGGLEKWLAKGVRGGYKLYGMNGKSSHVAGSFYQIASARSLGQTETEMLESVQKAVLEIAHQERVAREALSSATRRDTIKDRVFRAWEFLLNARSISYDEATGSLSDVRLGCLMGFEFPMRSGSLKPLLLSAQPAHVQWAKGENFKLGETDHWRAALIQRRLQGVERGA